PDLNATTSERGARESEGRSKAGTKRLFISIGSKDGLDPTQLKEFVVSTASVPFKSIATAEVKGVYSFLNVEDAYVDQLITAVNGSTFKDRPVRIEVSGDRPEGAGRRRESSYGGGRSEGKRSYGGGERKSYGDGGGE